MLVGGKIVTLDEYGYVIAQWLDAAIVYKPGGWWLIDR